MLAIDPDRPKTQWSLGSTDLGATAFARLLSQDERIKLARHLLRLAQDVTDLELNRALSLDGIWTLADTLSSDVKSSLFEPVLALANPSGQVSEMDQYFREMSHPLSRYRVTLGSGLLPRAAFRAAAALATAPQTPPPPEQPTKVVVAGRLLLTTTLLAASAPRLVRVIVYVTFEPVTTVFGAALAVTLKSAICINNSFGPTKTPTAASRMQTETSLGNTVMIESPEAVANVDAIAATKGVDVLFMGASDLTFEMGIPSQYGHDRVTEAVGKLCAACKKHGKIAGMGGVKEPSDWARYTALGMRVLLSENDLSMLMYRLNDRAKFFGGLPRS